MSQPTTLINKKVKTIIGDKEVECWLIPQRYYDTLQVVAAAGLPNTRYPFFNIQKTPPWLTNYRGMCLVPKGGKLRIKRILMSFLVNGLWLPQDYLSLYEPFGTLTINSDNRQQILECTTEEMKPEFESIGGLVGGTVPKLDATAKGGLWLANEDPNSGTFLGDQQNIIATYERHIAIPAGVLTSDNFILLALDCDQLIPISN